MNLTADSVPLVREATLELLRKLDPHDLVGVSCLARGADSIFAQAVLDTGGRLEVVLPSADYRAAKVKPDHAPQFDDLMSRASEIHTAPFAKANRDAYEAANEILLESCDALFAVWDGQAGVDKGSTGAVVAQARSRGIQVEIIWPAGAQRG
jgi:hypothetical protein